MAKSEYDKIYEARIAKALNEPSLLTRDAPPDTELTLEKFNEEGVKDSAGRMLSALQDPKTRDKAMLDIIKNNPDVSKKKVKSIVREILMEDDKREKRAEGKLGGGQKDLDLNKDGDLDEKDFKMLREGKQEGGMMMDDQMADMMQTEETPDMENQMADMLPERTEEQIEIEESQLPDEMMENNYIDFLIDEALDENEEEILMQELEANPQLSMLFDKVMEVAMEFSGSGPVEGPGSEVSDSIPARLSDGEFVFTAKAVEEIGADNLMSMMKEAEARAEGRQMAQEGGLMETEDTVMPVEQEPIKQEIRVTKETVGPQASMQEEDDLVGDEIKKSMLSGRPHVRS